MEGEHGAVSCSECFELELEAEVDVDDEDTERLDDELDDVVDLSSTTSIVEDR